MEEAWGCGTAAVISPIGSFAYQDKQFTVNNREIGPCAQDLYDTLTGIQWGRPGGSLRLDREGAEALSGMEDTCYPNCFNMKI